MQEIIHAFGIDWRLIVIQIFNFAVLAGALCYFLYTPILTRIHEREEKIKKGVLDAQEAERTLSEADTEKTRILKEAHVEASAIVGRGTLYAEEKVKSLQVEASEKISKQLTLAQSEAEALQMRALKESESEIAKMALLGAEKILNMELGKVE